MNDLLGKSTVKRRKEAKKLSQLFLDDPIISDQLCEALKMEENSRYWQTKICLLRAIGIQKCTSIADYIYQKYLTNAENGMVASNAATTYIRLKRKNINDGLVVLELLAIDNYNVKEGALEALGYDKMCPTKEIQKKIINTCFYFGKDNEKYFTDPRYGLAAACVRWDEEFVKPFLLECLKKDDVPLNYIAKKSLERKEVKLRSLASY